MLNIDNELFKKLIEDAKKSPRKRAHYNIHSKLDEPVQRLCIGLIKGTYIRPHYHPRDNGWEMIMVLKGDAVLLIFDTDGVVTDRKELSSYTGNVGIELDKSTYHMIFPVSDEAILFEVKEGPFVPKGMCDFVDWAPEEGAEKVNHFLSWAQSAFVGSKYS